MSSFYLQTQGMRDLLKEVCNDVIVRYWWADMFDEYNLNRLLLLPNSGHGVNDALTPRIPSVIAWISEVQFVQFLFNYLIN